MTYKFEKLEIYGLALDYLDIVYSLMNQLPRKERYNLHSQMVRAATSVVLNIAEGSTSQTNAEQARFLGLSLRSLVETVACREIIARRQYVKNDKDLEALQESGHRLFAKIQAMRNALSDRQLMTADGRPLTAEDTGRITAT